MIIALVGDVHGNTAWAKSAIYRAADLKADRIIFLGDFGYKFSHRFVSELAAAGNDVGLIIEWIDGNHEDFDYLNTIYFDLGPQFKYHQRGTVEAIDGIRFMFLGGATSVDRQVRVPGVEWWPHEQLSFPDIARGIKSGHADVILSHDAPYLPPMMDDDIAPFPKVDLKISAAHRYLYRMVYDEAQPKYVFHGHFHIPYIETYVEPWGEVVVQGLDCDNKYLKDNMAIIDTEDLK